MESNAENRAVAAHETGRENGHLTIDDTAPEDEAVVSSARLRGDNNNKDEAGKPDPLLLPEFKDQVRRAGIENDIEAGGENAQGHDSTIIVAQSVQAVLVGEIQAEPATLPAAVLNTVPIPSEINDKNSVGTVARPGTATANPSAPSGINSSHNINSSFADAPALTGGEATISQQLALHKHIVWAATLIIVVVLVITAAVMMTVFGPVEYPTSPSTPSPATSFPDSEIKLKASDGAADDGFGWSVAIHGDTIVIGSWLDDTDSGEGSGSAYVYTHSGTVWTEHAKLTASDEATGDQFGSSVMIDGDTIVIGAWRDDTENGEDSGSAYVYTLSGTVWTEQAKLTASDGAALDHFGWSVAIDGDTIVIGARDDDTESRQDSGSAYVYTHSGTVWTEQAKLLASDGAADDQFGISVAIDRDTVIIGADGGDAESGVNSGSAYVYTRSGHVWTEQAKLLISDGATKNHFGYSVAIDGETIVIGAYSKDTVNGINSGSAYVYIRSGTVWTEQAKLTASDGAANHHFGISVAIDADTLFIGADWDGTQNGVRSGSAYLYNYSGTVWTEQAKLTASDGAAYDKFGTSVAIDGDTIVIGAWQDDTENGENSGSAYTFPINT